MHAPSGGESSLLSNNVTKPGHACPQEQAALAASLSPEADNTSGKAAQHKEQLQHDLATAVKAEAEKTREIQSLGMLVLFRVVYGCHMVTTCVSQNSI